MAPDVVSESPFKLASLGMAPILKHLLVYWHKMFQAHLALSMVPSQKQPFLYKQRLLLGN